MNVVPLSKEEVLKKDIRVSIGSLALLGLRNVKVFAKPTTIYLMVEEHCLYNCLYCAQAKESKANFENLSRVTWPKEKFENVLDALIKHKDDYKRICFQVVNGKNYYENLIGFLKVLNDAELNVPISISIREPNINRIRELFSLGVERIGLPIDVVSKEDFSKIRGGNFEKTFSFILDVGKEFKGKITTHIIVGLNETDFELYDAMKKFFDGNVLVSLFSFTPVKGTLLEKHQKVPIGRYRKFQFIRALFFKRIPFEPIFENGILMGAKIDFTKEKILELVTDPSNYITQGCPNCNRPFYNETPTGPLYNFPVKPEDKSFVFNDFVKVVIDGKVFFK
ncbi:radical SAM protein [Caldisericum sp.]|uniref:radical SAM protein n=1 Tax=Caldisericum sp. TaxID=2499687 RepID=UPI003D14E8AC